MDHIILAHFSDIFDLQNYVNGKADGMFLSYYRSEEIRYKGKYKNGKEIGTWEYYDPNGNKREEFYS